MEITQEDREHFEAMLKEILGVDVPTLHTAINFINTQQTEHALRPVREAWGDAFDENYAKTKELFETLSAEQQAFYDNPDGVMYLFDTKVKPTLGQSQEPSSEVPSIAGSTTTTPTAQPTSQGLTRESISKMSPSEYKANAAQITEFYATGGATNPQ